MGAPVSDFQAPTGVRNFQEMALGFTSDIAKNNLGESFYRPWVPYVTTIFLFIFGCPSLCPCPSWPSACSQVPFRLSFSPLWRQHILQRPSSKRRSACLRRAAVNDKKLSTRQTS